jgi:hypothetical protein
MSEFVTKELCKEKHASSEKNIEEIKNTLRWVNREMMLGLFGIIGILISVIWKNI